MITFPQTVFVIDFCQFKYLFQKTFYVTINPRRLTIITFNFFVWNIISKNISNVSLRCLTFPFTERFSKALLQLKLDIADLIFSTFA